MDQSEKTQVTKSSSRYKTIRINTEDYQLLRKYAFEHNTSMVESISTALKLLIKEEKEIVHKSNNSRDI